MATTAVNFRFEFYEGEEVFAAATCRGEVVSVPNVGDLLEVDPFGRAMAAATWRKPYRVSDVEHAPQIGSTRAPEVTVVVRVDSNRADFQNVKDSLIGDGWAVHVIS